MHPTTHDKHVGGWRAVLLTLLDHPGATRAELQHHSGQSAELVRVALSIVQREMGGTCVRIDEAGRCWPDYDRDSVMRAHALGIPAHVATRAEWPALDDHSRRESRAGRWCVRGCVRGCVMSGCADVCLSHEHDGPAPAFCAVKWVRAKKEHRCCECGRAIAPGELYERHTGKWDGVVQAVPTCGVCAEIRAAFVCGSWVFGSLWESIQDEMFPVWQSKGAWDCLAKLTTPEAVARCNAEFAEWCRDWGYDVEPEGARDG